MNQACAVNVETAVGKFSILVRIMSVITGDRLNVVGGKYIV